MKFSYEDLISGDLIPVSGVGHIRSPYLRELKPTQGIGIWNYNIYLNLLIWEKNDILKFMKLSSGRKLKAIEDNEKIEVYDMLVLLPDLRKLLQDAMAFFMSEEIVWGDAKKEFITRNKETHEPIGCINRKNFEEVREMMLQVNYINVDKSGKAPKFSSKKAQELWEKAQEHLRKNAARSAEDKRMQLGNIISKLSCASAGYTLFNIYDLTIFQLYDQFFQYGYLRATDVSEMAYSNHGGKGFDIQGWLKPITNFEKEKQK